MFLSRPFSALLHLRNGLWMLTAAAAVSLVISYSWIRGSSPITMEDFVGSLSGFFAQGPAGISQKSSKPISSPTSSGKKWRICVCSMVHNEAAYLPEWIEFHRLQGVDHFVLYDHKNTDLVLYLPMWYESAGFQGILDIYPAKFVASEENSRDQIVNKYYAMFDCYIRHKELAEWVVVLDTDQFLYSPQVHSLWTFIKSFVGEESHRTNTAISAVAARAVTFGPPEFTSTELSSWLSPNAHTGSAEFIYRPLNHTSVEFPMVMETNTRRAPHPELDVEFSDSPVVPSFPVMLLKSSRCVAENITLCIYIEHPTERLHYSTPEQKNVYWPNLRELRVNHFPWRPPNQIQKASEQVNGFIPNTNVSAWFSSVVDDFGALFGRMVRKNIMQLKPKAFFDVGRDCHETALQIGQQVMCPASHPYPYGNQGVHFLRNCCLTDKDKSGNPLNINSGNCENDNSTACVEPLAGTRWLHRSCCIFVQSNITLPVIKS